MEAERQEAEQRAREEARARRDLQEEVGEGARRGEEDRDKHQRYQAILVDENKALSEQILQITEMYTQKGIESD